MRGALYVVIGTAVFVAITFFEQLPVLGWLGGMISIAAWIALTREMLQDREWGPIGGGLAVMWSGLLGGLTGFVGALTSWLAQTGNLLGLTTPPGDRFGAAFGFVGSTIALVYWPLVGALVCAFTALAVTTRRPRS